jgi:hypothetical protein
MVNPVAMLGAIAPGGNQGFSPFPIGIMPPFLEYQNAVMSRSFFMHGAISKRVIKAMSNEEFNAQFKEGFSRLRKWQEEQNEADRQLFYAAMEDARKVQKLIITEGVKVELEKIKGQIELYKSMPKAYWDAITGNATQLANIFNESNIGAGSGLSSNGNYNPITGEWIGQGDPPPQDNNPSGGGHGTTIGGSNNSNNNNKEEEEEKRDHTPFPNHPKGTPENPLVDPQQRVRMDINFKYPSPSRVTYITERLLVEANMYDHAQNAMNIMRFPNSIPNVDKRIAKSYAYKKWFRETYGFFPDSVKR